MGGYTDAYMVGVLIGAIFTGSLIGAIPAVCGAIKHKLGLALGGFFACLVSALLLGMILAIPVCALFLFFIFKKPKDHSDNSDETTGIEP